ncbi:arylesterase [Rubrivivax gelatinosus]|uniref:Arylesterase n=1 Tax=Rubrivivax gelatinosus TaxID=28068 RepID=A0ABS1E1P1_RUBGE|nr:arylesterase [Rubrivivax gelatinosus]MBK1715355.1 arylesterase [Rubrivivax gelatinosus]
MRWTRRQWLAHASALALAPAARAQSGAPTRTLLVLGDSLSAEYGLARGTGWVALLDKRVGAQAPGWKVVNASISGETTSGGRTRLPALLKQNRPELVILELGGNDALRGLPIANTRDNLAAMARSAREAGARVVVVGMEVPPNYGRRYAEDFSASFARVARETGAALVPFLLRGVADIPQAETLFQPDRIHPTAQAQPTMLDNVWPVLKPLLR